MLHPFREGNGRSQRLFISDLARENGYDLEWENISKEIMIEISRNDNIKETAEIFEKNLKEINQTIEKIRRKKRKNRDYITFKKVKKEELRK